MVHSAGGGEQIGLIPGLQAGLLQFPLWGAGVCGSAGRWHHHRRRQVELADAPGKTTIIEGGDHLAVAATIVMQSVGEIEAGPQPSQRLLQIRPVFDAETGVIQELLEYLQHRPDSINWRAA